MYNEYHVDSTSTNDTVTFPAECTGGLAKTSPFTPQEHMLEYSLFDLMNFSVPVVAPTVSIGITHSPTTFTGGDTGDTVTVTVAQYRRFGDRDHAARFFLRSRFRRGLRRLP